MALVELLITPTDEPITRGLAQAFPWIRKLPSIDLPGGGTMADFDKFYDVDFLRGSEVTAPSIRHPALFARDRAAWC